MKKQIKISTDIIKLQSKLESFADGSVLEPNICMRYIYIDGVAYVYTVVVWAGNQGNHQNIDPDAYSKS